MKVRIGVLQLFGGKGFSEIDDFYSRIIDCILTKRLRICLKGLNEISRCLRSQTLPKNRFHVPELFGQSNRQS